MKAERIVNIDGVPTKLCASALTVRLYRFKFGRDMTSDMLKLQKAYSKVAEAAKSEDETKEAQFNATDLTLFENVAYIMCKQANPDIPDDPDEWLDGMSMFSIYHILPVVLDVWAANQQTTSVPAKK